MTPDERDPEPTEQYTTLQATAAQLTEFFNTTVLDPVAKQHFEDDRGISVTQVLPDRTDDYHFASHGFEADGIPDERAVINHAYEQNSISPAGFTRQPQQFLDLIEAAEELWIATFGSHKPHIHQPDHPGPFPLQDNEFATSITELVSLYEDIIESNSLALVADATREDDYPLLAELFGTEEAGILNPSGTDLSALALMDSIVVPYNDGSLAVIRPATETTGSSPTRGVIVGHDDTPIGMFAHVTDVTNLGVRQTVTHDAIRDAMGFDRELDPWAETTNLQVGDGERIRLQGDLRVERTGDVAAFPDELARNTRIAEYEARIDARLQEITINEMHVRRRRSDVPVGDIVSVTASPDGTIVLDARTGDVDLELLAYATILCELDIGPAQQYSGYADIPYIVEPDSFRWSLRPDSVDDPAGSARAVVHEALSELAADHQSDVTAAAREVAAEAKAAMDVPRQVNLPIDNHLAFIERGFAPDVETEPVPVAVPEPSTLHIEHGEHNTVTVEIAPGVYRFSLLPRGLQPTDERPQWDEK